MHERNRHQSGVKTRQTWLRMIPVNASRTGSWTNWWAKMSKSAGAAPPSVMESQTSTLTGNSSTARLGHVLGCLYMVLYSFQLHGWYFGPVPTLRKGSLCDMESLMPPCGAVVLAASGSAKDANCWENGAWQTDCSSVPLLFNHLQIFNRFHPFWTVLPILWGNRLFASYAELFVWQVKEGKVYDKKSSYDYNCKDSDT